MPGVLKNTDLELLSDFHRYANVSHETFPFDISVAQLTFEEHVMRLRVHHLPIGLRLILVSLMAAILSLSSFPQRVVAQDKVLFEDDFTNTTNPKTIGSFGKEVVKIANQALTISILEPTVLQWTSTSALLEPVMHFGICAQQWLKTVQWLTHSHLKSAKFAFFGLTMSYLDPL